MVMSIARRVAAKPKTPPVAVHGSNHPPRDAAAQLVDEIGDLQEQVAKLKALQEQVAARRERLFDALTLEPGEEVTVVGERYVAKIGAMANVREVVDRDALIEFLGLDLFRKIAVVSMADIDRYLTPEQKGVVLKSTQSGSRKLTVVKTA